MQAILSSFDWLDATLWSYLGIPALVLFGLFLTFYFKFPQVLKIPQIIETFKSSAEKSYEGEDDAARGVTPLQAFFTSIGGCIGIANVVAVCATIQIGGPGALFWIWVAAFLGMMVKYCEVYLGVCYRVPSSEGGFNGGPMYFLQKVFKGPFVPMLVCILLCLYGTEVYMFTVVSESLVNNWNLNHYFVIAVLLFLVVSASVGGVSRVGKISGFVIPAFLVLYVGMCLFVFAVNFEKIFPSILLVFKSAFNPAAALTGGVAGTFLQTVQEGVQRGCYSGDIGVGYAGIVHAESSAKDPRHQARLSIFGVFLDSFVVCTSTALLVIITGVWNQGLEPSQMVQIALAQYFGMGTMNYFMPLFIFLLGYSTMIAFLMAGIKGASFLSPKRGKNIYLGVSSIAFIAFSFVDQSIALSMMGIVGCLLLLINVYGIFKLRDKIRI